MATLLHVFSTGGALGNTPPTQEQLEVVYAGTTLEGVVTSANGLQSWVVPRTGEYTIVAKGAAGGKGTGPDVTRMLGGFGAVVTGTFILQKGDKLHIVVGQKGTDCGLYSGDGTTASGGGMSAVLKEIEDSPHLLLGTIPVELLIIAGAGNGGGDNNYRGIPGPDAVLTEGTNEAYKTTSFSGGGFDANGTDAYAGKSLLSGAQASQYVYTRNGMSSQAGFGGGGSNTDDDNGGGGGGYRGGVRGVNGGSCFNAGANPIAVLNTDRTDGSIEIIQPLFFNKLVFSDGLYYYYDGAAWVSLGDTVTGVDYDTYGMESIDASTLSFFTTYAIYAFTPNIDDAEIVVAVAHKPLVQRAIRTVAVDFTDKVLTGCNMVATTEARVLVSVDDGETWQAYSDGWQTVDVTDLNVAFAAAMPAAALNAIHKNSWTMLGVQHLKLMFLVDTDSLESLSKVSEFTFRYITREV